MSVENAEINNTEIPDDERDRALAESQRMVMMQGVTINALQNRLWHLEMEIVDLMSASLVGPQPSLMESPE